MHVISIYLGLISQASNSISSNKHGIPVNLLTKAINYPIYGKEMKQYCNKAKESGLTDPYTGSINLKQDV
jgi:hypothetical protein